MRFYYSFSILLLFAAPAIQNPTKPAVLDAQKRKAIETLADDWFKARPATAFDDFDSEKLQKLTERARALDPIPQSSEKDIRNILWKAARKHGPKLDPAAPMTTKWGKAEYSVVNAPSGGDGTKTGLLIGLHGGGEGAGDKSEAQGTWSGALGKYKLMGIFPQAIQLVHDAWNTVEGERFLLTLIELAKRTYDIDPDRIYLAGFSMGGSGSWFMAGRHPQLLAGALPFHGVLFAAPDNQSANITQIHHGFVPNVRHVPLYYTTGSADKNCLPYSYLFAEKLLADLKKQHPADYDINFRCVEGLAHAYAPGEPQKAFEWLLNRKRKTFPKTLTWEHAKEIQFVSPGPRYLTKNYYWLRCNDPADFMRVDAEIKGQEIAINVKKHDPAGFTIFLNKDLIDVTKEIIVKINDQEKFRGILEPSFSAMIESLSSRLDRNMVFDRRIDL
ncbi:MAG: dienelactone hydrolase family protein [Planctomycetota bacterium]